MNKNNEIPDFVPTKEELKWAKKQAKLFGVKDAETFLGMRWSEVTKLAAEKGLTWIFKPIKAIKPKGARRPKKKKVS